MRGSAPRGYSWALFVVPAIAWLSSTLSTDFSDEYQAFVDFYPIHRTCLAPLCTTMFGPQRAGSTPALLDRFDWIIGHQGLGLDGHAIPRRRGDKDPNTVFASPNKVEKVLEQAERFMDAGRSDRILLLSGAPEFPASQALSGTGSSLGNRSACEATMARLRTYFRAVFFEGKDLEIEGLFAMPGGLTEMYLRGGVMESAAAAIAAADITAKSKPRGVLAAWGAVWSYVEQIDKGQMQLYSAFQEWTSVHLEAGKSRRLARAWSLSSAAREAGVEVRAVPAASWWRELAKYRFLMSPLGSSIYSPKTAEALLVLTVPLVRRGPFSVYDDMVKYGFPLVVVDEWDEISESKLAQWWAGLSPRLVSFRRNCLNTEGYWRIMTGAVHFCE